MCLISSGLNILNPAAISTPASVGTGTYANTGYQPSYDQCTSVYIIQEGEGEITDNK